MAHANVAPEEVLRKILNEVCDDEKDVALSTSFNFANLDNVNGVDQNVTGNQDNASNSAGTS